MNLPEFLMEETEDVILDRMLERVPDDIDKNEGSYIYDALAAAAAELVQMKMDMNSFLERGFASSTFGDYLDFRCQEHGLSRKPAVKAEGQVVLTGKTGVVISQGTVVATSADAALGAAAVEFVTQQDAVIPAEGQATVDIKAVTFGRSGNVLANTIIVLARPINGIESVNNTKATSGGEDTEDDASLLARFLAWVRSPSTSGNVADYTNWAMEVAGVGDVRVIPLWNGNGTVKVILVDKNKQPAAQSVVDAALTYIAHPADPGKGKAPIGATVTVTAATAVDIDVSATISLTGSKTVAEVKADFEKDMTDYLKEIAFSSDPTVRYVRIGSLLLDTSGVRDYSNLLVNGGSSNIVINEDQVGVKGTVTLNV